MMRRLFLILMILVLISCQNKDWKTNLLDDISEFETSKKIDKKFSIKHNSGNDIRIVLYKTHSNGLTKLTAKYERPEIGNWEKLFYARNGKVLHSRNFGIAPIQNLNNDTISQPDYILVEKIAWFKNDSIGIEEIKEIKISNLKNIESKKTELLKVELITSNLNKRDFKLIQSDFEALNK